eukprot:1183444-Amphidinium_carterae.1
MLSHVEFEIPADSHEINVHECMGEFQQGVQCVQTITPRGISTTISCRELGMALEVIKKHAKRVCKRHGSER